MLAAFSLDYFGRKNTIILASPLATLGWILIATATRYEVVIAARFLNGFCVGLCLPSAQVYVSITIHTAQFIHTNAIINFFVFLHRSEKAVIQRFAEFWDLYRPFSCHWRF